VSDDDLLPRYESLWQEHEDVFNEIDHKILSFIPRRKVYLFHGSSPLLRTTQFAFLRFLTWRLVHMKKQHLMRKYPKMKPPYIVARPIQLTPDSYKAWRAASGTNPSDLEVECNSCTQPHQIRNIRYVIPRLGHITPFTEKLSFLDRARSALAEQNKDKPAIPEKIWTEKWETKISSKISTFSAGVSP
jgi:hypothetical protein